MPENRDRGRENLSQMSTEELEQILRQDAEAPADQEADTDFLLDVMEVLAKRDKENVQTKKTAEEAWVSFQEHYAPDPEAVRSAKPVRPWLRRLIAAVAALVLILCIPVTAHAFNWDELWDVVARWAKETFSFVSRDAAQVSEPEATDAIEYASLQDLLERNKIENISIPTWVPDGFVLENVEKDEMPGLEIYRVRYSNRNRELKVRIQTHVSISPQNLEISKDLVEMYEFLGTNYYILSNFDQIQVVWIEGNYECTISGDISINDAKAMINSIEKG